MQDLRNRLYGLKITLFAILVGSAGLAILFLAHAVDTGSGPSWLTFWPLNELGSTLFITGLVVVALDYIDGKEREARDDERIRRLLKESAPAIRDAVIAGFVETPANMRGVATHATLDKLATNALAIRLGDETFASEIYASLLHQAIRTPERWHDVDVAVRLSCIQERSAFGAPRGNVRGPLFDVVVTWEYTVVPTGPIRRFASTNDLAEFHEFLSDVPTTSAWYVPPRSGADAREPASFEVLSYSVDGVDLPIRQTARKSGRTYSVDLGAETVANRRPVRIRHVYRTLLPRAGHRFRIALVQPTHGLSVSFDYTDTDIAELRVSDLISSATPAQVKFLPEEAPAKQVDISVPGWLLPQAEVTFVWTLEAELPPTP